MKSTPRSSRGRRDRDSRREDVAIGSPCPAAQPLGDEASGTGSSTASTQEVVDPAGVNDIVASQSDFPRRAFRVDDAEGFRMDRRVVDDDRRSLDLIGVRFRLKDLELEDDPELSSRRPSKHASCMLLRCVWDMATTTIDRSKPVVGGVARRLASYA